VARVLRSLLPRLPYFREVLISVDDDAMGYNLSEFGQDWQDRQYARYAGRLYHDGVLARWLADSAFLRLNGDLGALRSAPLPRVLPFDSSATPEGCRERPREHSEVKFRPDLIAENHGFLREIVELCRMRGLTSSTCPRPRVTWRPTRRAPEPRGGQPSGPRSPAAKTCSTITSQTHDSGARISWTMTTCPPPERARCWRTLRRGPPRRARANNE
jgi:hypothetical protein